MVCVSNPRLRRQRGHRPSGASDGSAADGVTGEEVDEVILGQVLTAGQGQNPARQAAINAGIRKEATAFGVKWIVETLEHAGVPVKRFVASGGLPAKSPLLMQIYADVLGKPIKLAESDQSVALGAAILGCLAAGPTATGYRNAQSAIKAMARQREDLIYEPSSAARKQYAKLYDHYRHLAAPNGPLATTMRALRDLPSANVSPRA